LILLLGAPIQKVGGIKSDAEEIGGDETELGSADSDHTDHGAIQGSHNPTLPELFTNEDGGQNGQNAGEIIESNHVEHIQHVWLMSRCRRLLKQFSSVLE